MSSCYKNYYDDNYHLKYTIYGYIRQIEHKYKLPYQIPNGIYDICASFYYRYFLANHWIKHNYQSTSLQTTPFPILHALINHKPLINVSIIDIEKECDYCLGKYPLKELNQPMVKCISSYQERSQLLLHQTSNILNWTDDDIIISFIHYLVNISNDSKARHHPKVWAFVSLLRLYLKDEDIQGIQFWKMMKDRERTNDNKIIMGLALYLRRSVCWKYSFKTGPFTKVNKQLNIWGQKLRDQFSGIEITQQISSTSEDHTIDYNVSSPTSPIPSNKTVNSINTARTNPIVFESESKSCKISVKNNICIFCHCHL